MKDWTPQLAAAINRFESAVRDHEMRGAQRPEDHEAIDKEYEASKEELTDLIAEAVNDGRV